MDLRNRIVIGTRGSKLALAQTEMVRAEMARLLPTVEIAVERIVTKGDKITDVPLARIGGKGLFTKELETALLDGRIDLAVHSLKDLPTELPAGLAIGAVLKREDPHDAIISHGGVRLADLPKGAKVGTSSLRRRAQLLAVRPDLEVLSLRGNLDTRLRKLDTGDLAGIVLARAGLVRLGFAERITEVIPFEVMLPAVGQGAIAVEVRAGDEGRVAGLNDAATAAAVAAERAFLARLEGGCQVPIGALGECGGGELRLRGVICSLDGKRAIRGTVQGKADSPKIAGERLAGQLMGQGADEILREVRATT